MHLALTGCILAFVRVIVSFHYAAGSLHTSFCIGMTLLRTFQDEDVGAGEACAANPSHLNQYGCPVCSSGHRVTMQGENKNRQSLKSAIDDRRAYW
jgi:hypothetical protein